MSSSARFIFTIALLVWFGLCASVLQLFIRYDWGRGLLRGVFLLCVAAIAFIPAAFVLCFPGAKFNYKQSNLLGIVAATLVLVGFGFHLYEGFHTLRLSSAQHRVWLDDEGEVTVHAILFLLRGVNPYGQRTMVDPAAYRVAVGELAAKPFCAEISASALNTAAEHFWQDPEGLVVDMAGLFPVILDDPRCATVGWRFSTVGFKYGPFTLGLYLPFVLALGEAGIYAAHLLFFIVLSILVWTMAYRMARGDLFLASLPFVILYLPSLLRINILIFSAVDLGPTLLALLAIWALYRKPAARPQLAGAMLGLSLASKVAPGIFYLPLLSRRNPVCWVFIGISTITVTLPFLIWDAKGLIDNWLIFGFARPSDSTSPMFFLNPAQKLIVSVVVLGSVGVVGLYGHLKRWPITVALLFVAAAHLGAIGIAPVLHNNYFVWVLPVLALLMLNTALQLRTEPSETRIESVPSQSKQGLTVSSRQPSNRSILMMRHCLSDVIATTVKSLVVDRRPCAG
jgi:hypothetical protein